MKAEIKGNTLHISIEMNKRPSKTGKTIVIASSNGNVPVPVEVDGKTLIVGLNAYIPADKAPETK